MHKYKISLEYIGTDFCGWQRQAGAISVQQVIEEAIYELSHEHVTVFAAGRTDAGVHARGQVAHFSLNGYYDPYRLMRSINHFMQPHKICIFDCALADGDFHARFSATARHYLYRIFNRNAPMIMEKDRVWHVKEPLDIATMREAASYLIGTHDFTSFRAKHCQAKSPVKTMSVIDIKQEGDEIHIIFSAPSFLHHMVRNIVGTLVMVGKGKISPLQIAVILENKDRCAAGITAPACGLYFMMVDYPLLV